MYAFKLNSDITKIKNVEINHKAGKKINLFRKVIVKKVKNML